MMQLKRIFALVAGRATAARCGIRGLSPIACAVLLASLHAVAAAADPPPPPPPPPDQTRGASSGATLELSDFKGAVPKVDDRPKDVHGNPVAAETATEIGISEPGDGTPGTDKGGKNTYTPTSMKVTLDINQSQSWNSDKTDNNLLDHERGHLDQGKISQAKAQALINKLIANKDKSIVGVGDTPAKAQDDSQAKAQKIAEDIGKADQTAYDDKTESGTNSGKQKAARDAQAIALKKPNTDPNAKTGPEAKSVSPKTILYDASTGRLHIENDLVVATAPTGPGYVPDPVDPIIGAELLFPDFELRGRTVDGLFFFSALGLAPMMTLNKADITYLGTDLESLVYDPALDMFHGLGGAITAAQGLSRFVDALLDEVGTGPLSLIGVELLPEIDFMILSAGFTTNAASGFHDFQGLRQLSVAEPGSLGLLLAALVAAEWSVRRRRGQAGRATISQATRRHVAAHANASNCGFTSDLKGFSTSRNAA
ncbi:MAG: hypothetical protein ABI343_22495 [Burkholderiaceae bacterium]